MVVVPTGGFISLPEGHCEYLCSQGLSFLLDREVGKCRQCVFENQRAVKCDIKEGREEPEVALLKLPSLPKGLREELKDCPVTAEDHGEVQKV